MNVEEVRNAAISLYKERLLPIEQERESIGKAMREPLDEETLTFYNARLRELARVHQDLFIRWGTLRDLANEMRMVEVSQKRVDKLRGTL